MKPKVTLVHFRNQPSDRTVSGNWKITTGQWACTWSYGRLHRELIIDIGTYYDGNSSPKPGRMLFDLQRDGMIRAASLAHDELSRSMGGIIPREKMHLTDGLGHKVLVSKREADLVYREMALFSGVRRRKCYLAFFILKIAGKSFWGHESPSGPPPKGEIK